MRMTKALALLFAMVMVVVCFNVPAICDDGDEHPWDNDGTGPIGSHKIVGSDTTTTITNPITPVSGGNDSVIIGLFLDLQFIINYQIIPDFNLDFNEINN
ncbi:MAG: hypothetical protein ABIJ45_02980 [Candidatus Zixiibacteriota bacterium]